MGYTHYLYRTKELPAGAFATFTTDAEVILAYATSNGIALAGPSGSGTPVISPAVVAFNGASPSDYESCVVERVIMGGVESSVDEDGRRFSFCKTQCRPYDIVVAAIYALAADVFGSDAAFESDGDAEAIEAGRAYAEKALGRPVWIREAA